METPSLGRKGVPMPKSHRPSSGSGLTTVEQGEFRELRRENRSIREEREILRKTAVWFAKETTSIPSKDSSS